MEQEKLQQYKCVKNFIDNNYHHFNSAVVKDASRAYVEHINKGGKMLLAMAGAMSTAELGISLADMIREDKIHAISTTGANLEEDLFNLVAHDFYERVPDYRYFTKDDEEALLKRHMNRVTDTCIPEEEAMRRLERVVQKCWFKAQEEGKRYFPYEFMYQAIRSGELEQYYQIDPKNSWILAACEKNIPIFVPGWEDSTLGNFFVSGNKRGEIKDLSTMKSGLELMSWLIEWYKEESKKYSIGFFQIGGGIAGDFPICVVPLLEQDLLLKDVRKWGYFCQISDSTTSYGSYSGAVPNEKITWGKLEKSTPSFVIESDATIVAPLIFSYILGQ
jgi:deoxyhypusine synthase